MESGELMETTTIGQQAEKDLITSRFMEIKDVIKDTSRELKDVTKEGFASLQAELRLSREQGHIPVSVMKEILNSNNEAYKSMINSVTDANKENRKSSDTAYQSILKTVCYMMAGVLAWVTGMKIFLPEIAQLKANVPQVIERVIIPPVK